MAAFTASLIATTYAANTRWHAHTADGKLAVNMIPCRPGRNTTSTMMRISTATPKRVMELSNTPWVKIDVCRVLHTHTFLENREGGGGG